MEAAKIGAIGRGTLYSALLVPSLSIWLGSREEGLLHLEQSLALCVGFCEPGLLGALRRPAAKVRRRGRLRHVAFVSAYLRGESTSAFSHRRP